MMTRTRWNLNSSPHLLYQVCNPTLILIDFILTAVRQLGMYFVQLFNSC